MTSSQLLNLIDTNYETWVITILRRVIWQSSDQIVAPKHLEMIDILLVISRRRLFKKIRVEI